MQFLHINSSSGSIVIFSCPARFLINHNSITSMLQLDNKGKDPHDGEEEPDFYEQAMNLPTDVDFDKED